MFANLGSVNQIKFQIWQILFCISYRNDNFSPKNQEKDGG